MECEGTPLERAGAGGPAQGGSAALRAALLGAGLLFVALAALGAFLPMLPTTPFLLLASACFARSSPRLHAWLHRNRLLGPYLREWQKTRSIPLRAKLLAVTLVVAGGAASLSSMRTGMFPKALLASTLLLVIAWLLSRPSVAGR